MDLILLGPGRAGTALSLAAVAAGHRIVAVSGRDASAAAAAAERLGGEALPWASDLPAADIVIVAVRDDAIAEVAEQYAGRVNAAAGAAHLSGIVASGTLGPIGVPAASFHPLQTMPTPDAGAERLDGAWVGITSDDDYLSDRLFAFAASLGMRPFELPDTAKALYHAGAAAASNAVVAALAVAQQLFDGAEVPFEALEPLVEAVTRNAFDLGPDAALTGPIARGDAATVRAQVEAVREGAPDAAAAFEALVQAIGRVSGREHMVDEALR